ncbi:hypothetical protein DICPUDRAFT_55995 [Dictyostelium purpureum]|uniref:Major facilitator superfamily (MFS) profile domain-containing protein n=1 Tax=Dictyostelium purpureum TaxID=5786 RepID=F0ZPC6_DICPU|nr:uncharacterized protein DICPUDRAFT_55995 [Dictyostelium purpureum]EGC34209.1 hypothetical protein DICPUDRAFT_55995 [Dictyostelium purpureum]|eukprot:XP_003289261.1 hypothetical protein DICPUDRAFT_55995 [Dictyostelium purpureum]
MKSNIDDIDEYYYTNHNSNNSYNSNGFIDNYNFNIINEDPNNSPYDEDDPLISDLLPKQSSENTSFKVYKSRWWVLFIFMLLSLNQCNFWITFGTVAPMASQFYDTSISSINWLCAIGPLVFIPLSMIFSWSIGRYGIRKNILIAAFLVAAGGVIRCIPMGGDKTFFLIIIGQVLNASAGPCVMVVPTKISAVWFAPEERTLSTAIGTLSNFIGSAIGFLLALVCTDDKNFKILLYSEAGFAVALFVLVCIYFPEKPPTPPSATSYFSDVKSNHKKLVDSSEFMTEPSAALLCISCALTSGVYAGWGAVFVEIVSKIYTQTQAKWLGFFGIIAGMVGGLLFGWIHDRVHNYKKLLIIIFSLNTVVYVLFSLLVEDTLPDWYWLGQFLNVVGGFLINSYYPIIYEAAVEVSYPVPESVGTAIISILINVITFVAIMVCSIVPAQLLNWVLVGASGISLILLLFVKEDYKRSKNDNLANFESSNYSPKSSFIS